MSGKYTSPIYMQVAVDVAGRIADEELVIGQKISGRSTFASEYNVSSETVRKAMGLLQEVGIVEVKQGNGIYVASLEHAKDYIEAYRIKSNINDLKDRLRDLMEQRDLIEEQMNATMNAIVDYTSRFRHSVSIE